MRFSSNESTADRIVRAVAGVILAALAITGTLSGTLAAAALVVAAILIVTAAVGFCPLYAILRIGTKRSAG